VTTDAIALLTACNPVADLPPVEPVERLRKLIEGEALPITDGAPRQRPTRVQRCLLAGALATGLASAIGLLLAGGSSGPGLNVAAAAYAATSPGSGIIEAVFVQHFSGPAKPLRSREWIDASSGRRRVQQALPAPRRPIVTETVAAPGFVEIWTDREGEANVIHRNIFTSGAPLGSTQPTDGIELYRRLYREDAIKLVGRERHNGRLFWKLEGNVGFAGYSAGRDQKLVPVIGVVVLVDPRTYLPVVQREVNLISPGHPMTGERDLLSYRHLPAGPSSELLFELTAQHPHARVLTRAVARPAGWATAATSN
jgi:hypothetical protein